MEIQRILFIIKACYQYRFPWIPLAICPYAFFIDL